MVPLSEVHADLSPCPQGAHAPGAWHGALPRIKASGPRGWMSGCMNLSGPVVPHGHFAVSMKSREAKVCA